MFKFLQAYKTNKMEKKGLFATLMFAVLAIALFQPSVQSLDSAMSEELSWVGRFEKYQGNPILSPRGTGFEAMAVFNPAIILNNGKFYMFYRAELKDLNFSPGIESLEVRLFSESEIPWTELAFPVINNTLAHYFSDRKTQVYPTHVEDIIVNR